MTMRSLSLVLCAATALSAGDNPNRNFTTVFSGCREYVAFGPISAAKAHAALPAGFTPVPFGSDAALALRASSCDGVSVAGSPFRPGIVAHYGINIVSPDATGDINNYTLYYATNIETLADQLKKTGLPVIYNPSLAVEDPATRPGNVYIGIFGDNTQPWSLTGVVTDPVAPIFPFIANWWYQSKTGRLKMSTDIPSISFGASQLVLHTSKTSPLGNLIGGNTKSDFPFYNVRGQFASGVMTSTTTR